MPPEQATAPDPAPDPVTNTRPGEPGMPLGADGNFDYLDTLDASMSLVDKGEFEDDIEGGEAAEREEEPAVAAEQKATPGQETTQEAGGLAAAQEVGPEPEPSVTTPDIEALEAKAIFFDEFDNSLRTDPAAVAQAIVEGMDARQRAAFLSQFGERESYPEFNIEEYEPQGEMEEALKSRWNDINAIGELVSENRRLDEQINQNHEMLIPHVSEANVCAQIALFKLDMLCEALGIDLPDPDSAAILKALDGGKATYRDAIRKSVDYKKAVSAAKQQRAERPLTPGSASKRPERIPEGTDMVTIARRLGTLR